MAIESILDPRVNIYDPYPPAVYQGGFLSPWVCAHLPILYKLQSDFFPDNTGGDSNLAIAYADNGAGLTRLTTNSAHGWNPGQFVSMDQAAYDEYNGTFEIIAVSDTTHLDINVPFNGAAWGAAPIYRYYNNYFAKIEFYQGLASHSFSHLDPESLKATVRVSFDSNNQAYVDLSRLAQAYVNSNNSNQIPSFPNQMNLWTQVRMKIWEVYDSTDADGVVSQTENDEGFEEYLYPVNAVTPFRSRYGPNMGAYLLNNLITDTKFLTPRSNGKIFPGYYYDISILVYQTGTFFMEFAQTDSAGASLPTEVVEVVFPDIGLYRIRLDDLISSLASCATLNLGGTVNFGWDQIGASISGLASLPREITRMSSPVDGFIALVALATANPPIDQIDFAVSTDGGATWLVKAIGQLGQTHEVVFATPLLGVVTKYRQNDAGRTRSWITSDGGLTWSGGNTMFIGTPQELYSLSETIYFAARAVAGTIWKSTDAGETFSVTTMDTPLTGTIFAISFASATVGWAAGTDGGGVVYKTTDGGDNWVKQTIPSVEGLHCIVAISTTVALAGGDDGDLIKTTDGSTWATKTSGTAEDIQGISFSDANNGVFVAFNGVIRKTDDAGETWEDDVKNTTINSNLFDVQLFSDGSGYTFGTSPSEKIFRRDTFVVADPPHTETKQICIDRNCSNQQIYLTWLNNLAGWEYHLFTAEKEFLTDISESSFGDRSLYNNWPTSYITGETVREWLRVKGRDSILVRSQFLSQAQADEVARIQQSIHVQWMMDGLDDKVTVLVDKSSFRRYNESDKLITIEFRLQMTDEIPVQSN